MKKKIKYTIWDNATEKDSGLIDKTDLNRILKGYKAMAVNVLRTTDAKHVLYAWVQMANGEPSSVRFYEGGVAYFDDESFQSVVEQVPHDVYSVNKGEGYGY